MLVRFLDKLDWWCGPLGFVAMWFLSGWLLLGLVVINDPEWR